MRVFGKQIRHILPLLLVTGVAQAQQDADLKSGNLRPRTAMMSEEVARQKLVVFGLKPLSSLAYVNGRYVARVQQQTRVLEVEIDAQSGVLRERGRVLVLVPPPEAGTPMLRDHTLKIGRMDIARAPLVIVPLVPERPQAIRPVGAAPAGERPDVEPTPTPTPAAPETP